MTTDQDYQQRILDGVVRIKQANSASVNSSDIPPLSLNYIVSLVSDDSPRLVNHLLATAKSFVEKEPNGIPLYFDFADSLISGSTEELELVLKACRTIYPNYKEVPKAFFFLNIDRIPRWEQFVRRCLEHVQAFVMIAGKDKVNLYDNPSTTLRGRYLRNLL